MQVQQHILVILLPLGLVGCVEPFEPDIVSFESALVVEATITDENKLQEVLLSRTFPLDTTGIYAESGAMVQITDSEGATFGFTHQGDGRYVSNASFAARNGIGYQLKITTTDGNEYMSEEEIAPAPTQIDSLYAERDFKDGDANEGMFIYADAFDASGENKYYRYEYEETYKIIAPYWGPQDYFYLGNNIWEVLPRTIENLVCYNTINSEDIIQTTTNGFLENRISEFPVRFINRFDFKLTYRYSLNVIQYVQSRQAYGYYELLSKLNSSESLFSQIQNGFLEGNIKSIGQPLEKVVGFFQVNSMAEKRLFFNYTDYFPNEPRPAFPEDCYFTFSTPTLFEENSLGDIVFYEFYDPVSNPRNLLPPFGGELGTMLGVPRPCGDCTFFGSNVVPEFWVE